MNRIRLPAIFSWRLLILLGILIVAAYLRLWRISEYLTFLGDEGRDVLVVKRMIVDGDLTLLGPTASVGGFFLGPIYYYFMAPFLWLWRLDPTGPAVMVGLFGVGTVALVYLVGKQLFNEWIGIIAASLYSLSPVVIRYSRSSWNPNVVQFFSTVLIFFLWRLVTKKRQGDALWIGLVLGIGLQLHYLFLFLFVLVGIWYILHIRVIPFARIVLLTSVGFLIGYSPFIAFELLHGFPNTQSIVRYLLAGKETGFSSASYFSIVGDAAFRSFGRLLFRLPEYRLWNGFPDWQINLWVTGTRTALLTSIGLVFVVSASTVAAWLKKKSIERTANYWISKLFGTLSVSQRTGAHLMLLWFGLVVLLFGLYKREIYDYYFGIIFAAPFLLFAFSLWTITRSKAGKILAGIFFAWLIFFSWQGRPFAYAPNRQLDQVKLIAQTAFDQTEGKPFNFALVTDGNSDHAYRYFFEIWGNPPVTIENEQQDPERKSVTDQLIVLCETFNCQPLGHPLWEIAGFGRAQIAGAWDTPFVKIYKLVHYTGEEKL